MVAPALYADRLVTSEKHDSEIASSPNRDVLSMRASILRAKWGPSNAVSKHKGVLFALASYRDILAHRPSNELDEIKVAATLVRDVYPLLEAVAAELGVSPDSFVGGQAVRLGGLAAKHQKDVADRVRMTLKVHRSKWKQHMGVHGFVEKMISRTASALVQNNRRSVECPACGNQAVLSVEVDMKLSMGSRAPLGRLRRRYSAISASCRSRMRSTWTT